eukprot:scaffold3004_cov119-Skeletonema_dohrnii-CCMP3373.AAC.3
MVSKNLIFHTSNKLKSVVAVADYEDNRLETETNLSSSSIYSSLLGSYNTSNHSVVQLYLRSVATASRDRKGQHECTWALLGQRGPLGDTRHHFFDFCTLLHFTFNVHKMGKRTSYGVSPLGTLLQTHSLHNSLNMPLLISLSPIARRRRRQRSSSSSSVASPLAVLISCCYLLLRCGPQQPLLLLSAVHAGESTIPRSTNRYSDYNRQSSPSSSAASISSPSFTTTSHDYLPPWNPSPKIDPHGFLTSLYPRTPGEWEHLANIRGKYGPRSRSYPRNLRTTPVEIRQVPGDGNCLFHSIAACLHHTENEGQHLPMDSHERILELRSKSLELRNAAVDVLHNVSQRGRRKLFLQGEEYLEARELLAAAAAQFELEGEEYCELMRKESYWGGGPEIVALCNYLQRPIHM